MKATTGKRGRPARVKPVTTETIMPVTTEKPQAIRDTSYRARLQTTEQELHQHQLDNQVKMAENKFDIGIADLKGQVLVAEGKVREAEYKTEQLRSRLEEVKRYSPDKIVQALLDVRVDLLNEETKAKEVYDEYLYLVETLEFIEKTKAELF